MNIETGKTERIMRIVGNIVLPFLVLSVISCSMETNPIKEAGVRTYDNFTASIQRSDVKALIDTDGSVRWNEGDCILVFSDIQKEGVAFEWDGKSAFRGESISGSSFYAYYPYNGNVRLQDMESLILEVDPIYITENNLTTPMVAKSSDNQLVFKQTCALLHFIITGEGQYNLVRLSNNGQEVVNGIGSIDLKEDNPTLTIESDSKVYSLTYYQELNLDESGKTELFFALPECVLEDGFTLELMQVDRERESISNYLSKMTRKRLDARRGCMYSYEVDTSEMTQEEIFDQRAVLTAFYQATDGDNWIINTNWCTDAPISSWYGISENWGLVDYINLQNNNLTGSLTPELAKLKGLTVLALHGNKIGGTLPSELAEMRSLEHLNVTGNLIEGEIPDNYPGYIKETWVFGNRLSGSIPAKYLEDPGWNENWSRIIGLNNYSLEDVSVFPTPFSDVDIDGNPFNLLEECAKNKYTAFFVWWSGCPAAEYYVPVLREAYEIYKDQGFEIISCNYGDAGIDEDTDTIRAAMNNFGIDWRTYVAHHVEGQNPHIISCAQYPTLDILDKTGRLVFSSSVSDNCYQIKQWLQNHMGATPQQDRYTSTDFSHDGKMDVLQTATEGKGIDLVFMGDGYSDRLIASGKYSADMNRAVDAFFSVEPYKSFQNMFNVYVIEVVSENEGYMDGNKTALGGWFLGTDVGGNDTAVYNYLTPHFPGSLDETTVAVLMNRDYYAGVCHMVSSQGQNDYGSGLTISYFPACRNEETLSYLVHHEVGGHGFAKLDDEYSYPENGYILQSVIDERKAMVPLGWWKNVDFTSDPTRVKWATFINDSRYESEKIGVYEGACTYWQGAWRPSEDSIMNHNTVESFNAPSREAIWNRLHKLAYGPEWEYDYEGFVSYDAKNRASPQTKSGEAWRSSSSFPTLSPPVIVRIP